MSKEAMEAVLANSKSKGGPRGVLLALAWKTYDRAPPFKGPFTVRHIATLANVGHRQAQADVAALRKLGELVPTGKQGREYVYAVNVALANYGPSDVLNYGPSDVDTTQQDANYGPSDVLNYGPSDVLNYGPSDVLTTAHPSYGSYKETRNKREQGVTLSTPFLDRIAQSGPEAEQTPSPLPPSPVASRRSADIWRSVLEHVKRQGIASQPKLDRLARARLELFDDELEAIVLVPSSSEWYRTVFGIAIDEALYYVTRRHWRLTIASEQELREWAQEGEQA